MTGKLLRFAASVLVLASISVGTAQRASAQMGLLPDGVWPGAEDGPGDRYRVREFNVVYYRSTNPGATIKKADRIDRYIDRYWDRVGGARIETNFKGVYPTPSGPMSSTIVESTIEPIPRGWTLILEDSFSPPLAHLGAIDHAYFFEFYAELEAPFGYSDFFIHNAVTLPLKHAYSLTDETATHAVASGNPFYDPFHNVTMVEVVTSEPNYAGTIAEDGNIGGFPTPTLAPLAVRPIELNGEHWIESNGTQFHFCHPTFARWVDPDGVHPVPPNTLDLYFWDHSSDVFVLAATRPWPTNPNSEWNHSRVDLCIDYSFAFLDSNQFLEVVPSYLYPGVVPPGLEPSTYNAVELQYAASTNLARGPNDPHWNLPTLDRDIAGPQGFYEGTAGMWYTTRPLYSHDLGSGTGMTGGAGGGGSPPGGGGGGSTGGGSTGGGSAGGGTGGGSLPGGGGP